MTETKNVARGAALVALFAMMGCALNVEDVAETTADEQADLGMAEQAMPWRANDAPSIFGHDLDYVLETLPREGQAAMIPWAGNYWPTYLDNINHRWAGETTQSPAEKYGLAFGVTGVEDAVSKSNGIDSQSSRTACTQDSECKSELGEVCAKRTGKESGRCVATWFGICHAWAPVALMYPEPKKEVVRNGVTFQINDIKALLTLAHDKGLKNKFASGRCNSNDRAGDIQYDQYGRPTAEQCIDTNPASYHILLANYLGLKKQSFVEDRTYDHEVWNQPIRGFKVTKLEEVTAQQANELVGVGIEGGVVETRVASVGRSAWQHFGPFAVAEAQGFQAQLSGTGDVDMYVAFGAQPTDSVYACRPYASSSNESCDLTVPAGATEAFVSLKGYSDASNVTLGVTTGGAVPAAYKFNDKAVKFYDVRTEVQYISESAASTDGNLAASIDRYTHTDRYTYVLEVDAEGRLVGGEWTGASKKSHVDFVWLPTEVSEHTIAGGKLKLADIMSLYRASVREGEETLEQRAGSVPARGWQHYGPFDVPSGLEVRVAMSGTGDADLYVRRGAQPAGSAYDCRPYTNGSSETCAVVSNGPVYVSVYGYSASNFALEIRY